MDSLLDIMKSGQELVAFRLYHTECLGIREWLAVGGGPWC